MTPPRHDDDSLMGRFERHGLMGLKARDAIFVVLVVAVVLALFEGPAIRHAGNQMKGGVGRDIVLAIGRPTSSASHHLQLASVTHDLTGFLSPDQNLSSSGGGFAGAPAAGRAGAVPPVSTDAFSPAAIGARPPARRPLHTLLVTGDSMSQPLDADLARRLVGRGVTVHRDPHLGTAISDSSLVDWGKLAVSQVHKDAPDAVVMFIGANEGWPMKGPRGRAVNCCTAQWAALYAQRVRVIANTYRRNGAARVYWVLLPLPREAARARVARVVNAAIEVGLQPWAAQTRIINAVSIFTPHGYRAAMSLGGTDTIVRESDGIHLNEAGSELLAGRVIATVARDFRF